MEKQEPKIPEIKVRHPKALEFERNVESAKHIDDIIDLIRGFIEIAIPDELKRQEFSKGIVSSLTEIVMSMMDKGRNTSSVVPLFQRIAKESVLEKLESLLVFPASETAEILPFSETLEMVIVDRILRNCSRVICQDSLVNVPNVLRPVMETGIRIIVSKILLPRMKKARMVSKIEEEVPEDKMRYHLEALLDDTENKKNPLYFQWDDELEKFTQQLKTALPEKAPPKPKVQNPKVGTPEMKQKTTYEVYLRQRNAYKVWNEDIFPLFKEFGGDPSFTPDVFAELLTQGLRINEEKLEYELNRMRQFLEQYDENLGQSAIYGAADPVIKGYKGHWGELVVLTAFIGRGHKMDMLLKRLSAGHNDKGSIRFIMNYLRRQNLV